MIVDGILYEDFRVIIAGGRKFVPTEQKLNGIYRIIDDEIDNFMDLNKKVIIVEGGAKGADRVGRMFGHSKGYQVETYEADWYKFGRKAGPFRNTEMQKVGNMLIAFWDGISTGTRDMINKMKASGKPVCIIYYREILDMNKNPIDIEFSNMIKRINYA